VNDAADPAHAPDSEPVLFPAVSVYENWPKLEHR
jgi:hypothetical protein